MACTSLEEMALQSNSFDVAVAGDILQMVPDDRATLNELRRVLKDGGTLCLTVPPTRFSGVSAMKPGAISAVTALPIYDAS